MIDMLDAVQEFYSQPFFNGEVDARHVVVICCLCGWPSIVEQSIFAFGRSTSLERRATYQIGHFENLNSDCTSDITDISMTLNCEATATCNQMNAPCEHLRSRKAPQCVWSIGRDVGQVLRM